MEEPIPWSFNDVIFGRHVPLDQADKVDEEKTPFYKLNDFKLYKRNPISIPPFLGVSANYFNPRWSGERRLKNVVAVLEYVPAQENLSVLSHEASISGIRSEEFNREVGAETSGLRQPTLARTLSVTTQTTLQKAFKLLDLFNEDEIRKALMKHVINAAMDFLPSDAVRDEVYDKFKENGRFTINSLRRLLLSDTLRKEENGRYYVALSLAEAESLRRIMHLRGREIREQAGIELKLRILPLDFAAIDVVVPNAPAAAQLPNPAVENTYQASASQQTLRFFDGELQYSDKDINILLRALQGSPCTPRQVFFEHVMGCRRRLRRKWQESPLAQVFTLRSEFHLLQQRAQVFRMRLAIAQRKLSIFEAFTFFDSDKNGHLSPGKLWASTDFLSIPLDAHDIVDLMRSRDLDGDGNLGWGDFSYMLKWNDDELTKVDRILFEGEGAIPTIDMDLDNLPHLQAKDDTEVKVLWQALDKDAAKQAQLEQQEQMVLEEQRRIELEVEEDNKDRERGLMPNPLVEEDKISFDFSTGKLPRKVTAYGFVEYRSQADGKYGLFVDKKSYLQLPLSHPVFQDTAVATMGFGVRLNRYTVAMHVNLKALPINRQALFRTARPTALNSSAAEIVVQSDGSVGFGMFCDGSLGRLTPMKWHHVAFAVDITQGSLTCFIDGQVTSIISGFAEELYDIDGSFSLSFDPEEGLYLAASGEETGMLGVESVRSVVVYNRPLTPDEVQDLFLFQQASSSWNCEQCTTSNDFTQMLCRVCEYPRPASAAPPVVATSSLVAPAPSQNSLLVQQLQEMGIPATDADVEAATIALGDNADSSALLDYIMQQKFGGM
eukprot:GILI01005967.1.p1 GENE.GILI01005967.1~~GILI01005967.1.p1  ORF type:complete len:834 (-),score=335.55 GILI01005967.1:93-2594(-)